MMSQPITFYYAHKTVITEDVYCLQDDLSHKL
jgi:hypothetical protein